MSPIVEISYLRMGLARPATVDFTKVEDAAYVAMRNLPRDPHLATKTLDEVRAVAFGQELERELLSAAYADESGRR